VVLAVAVMVDSSREQVGSLTQVAVVAVQTPVRLVRLAVQVSLFLGCQFRHRSQLLAVG
jgi:hypothetical protein